MKLWQFTLTPRTSFGSPLVGDSLFGHACWTIRNAKGNESLCELLKGYTDGGPFIVFSDALPSGYLPRPTIPLHFFKITEGTGKRKEIKRKRWLPVGVLKTPFEAWLDQAEQANSSVLRHQSHNSINRLTGTTSGAEFAPYDTEQIWHDEEATYDLYICLDESRMDVSEARDILRQMGLSGFGRDSSIGLGKFDISDAREPVLPPMNGANAYLTLAPCAPQEQGLKSSGSFYEIVTRFGRHGDVAAIKASPFKNPVLLANTGAVFRPETFKALPFIGRGLGGDGSLSVTLPETVHQGYAPVVPISLPEGDEVRQ
ncbi:MAG: CRISPR-associated protein Csm7 [Planctomycetota bacterium]|jgi:CRISPR-associated protein Csm4|nr:CRISPR-associated protein Csm7 [Planctomycetota bacterium]